MPRGAATAAFLRESLGGGSPSCQAGTTAPSRTCPRPEDLAAFTCASGAEAKISMEIQGAASELVASGCGAPGSLFTGRTAPAGQLCPPRAHEEMQALASWQEQGTGGVRGTTDQDTTDLAVSGAVKGRSPPQARSLEFALGRLRKLRGSAESTDALILVPDSKVPDVTGDDVMPSKNVVTSTPGVADDDVAASACQTTSACGEATSPASAVPSAGGATAVAPVTQSELSAMRRQLRRQLKMERAAEAQTLGVSGESGHAPLTAHALAQLQQGRRMRQELRKKLMRPEELGPGLPGSPLSCPSIGLAMRQEPASPGARATACAMSTSGFSAVSRTPEPLQCEGGVPAVRSYSECFRLGNESPRSCLKSKQRMSKNLQKSVSFSAEVEIKTFISAFAPSCIVEDCFLELK